LSLSGGEDDSPFHSFSYIYINCSESSTKPFNYPELTIFYYITDIELISPMVQNLTRGDKNIILKSKFKSYKISKIL